jgi:uncharacterized protein
MDPWDIIKKYYKSGSQSYHHLTTHSQAVASKALDIARNCPHKVNIDFIHDAAMLHDIGIFMTYAPQIGCHGSHSYICHGWMGGKILRQEKHPKLARACERHIGVGLEISDIKEQKLPLPLKDMSPKTKEEEIVSLADLFFSKNSSSPTVEKNIDDIKTGLEKFGQHKKEKFLHWLQKYKV